MGPLATGFSLLEVVGAMAVLSVAMLGVAAVMTQAVEYVADSHSVERALALAEQRSADLETGSEASGWQWLDFAGELASVAPSGADGSAERDAVVSVGGDPAGGGPACRRRTVSWSAGERTWFEVRVECGAPERPIAVVLRVLR